MRIAPLLLLPLVLGGPGRAQEGNGSVAPLLEHQKLRQAMTRLASEHADLVSVLAVGWSRGQRRLEALRLAAGELAEGRPAILVVANLDGPLVYTSGVALEVARRLAQGYAQDERVQALLDTTTVYVIPRGHHDAAEARFARPLAEVRATGAGVDDDRDGRAAEDGPSDVNGDGFVSVMRVPDPEGTWVSDPTDPRVLVEAERAKGERGRWKLVPEGRDSDGDGEVAEDPAADAEVNRNFGAGFEEHVARAGRFATDEPETRGLVEFVLGREDIQLVLVYGELDNLVQAPDSVDDEARDDLRIPPPGLRESDAILVTELGRRYREATGSEVQGSGDDAGTFQRWCYEHRGILTLSARLFQVPAEALPDDEQDSGEGSGEDEQGTAGDDDRGGQERPDVESGGQEQEPGGDEPDQPPPAPPEPSDDALRLAWLAAHGVTDAHLGWTAFQHPELGPLEIGGFRPYALLEPPDDERAGIVDGQVEFLLGLGEVLARVTLEDVTLLDLGAGLLELKASVVNDGLLPLITRWGERTRTTRPAKVLLRLPENARILAGERQTLVDDLPGLGGRHELTWLVHGADPAAIGISVDTDNAGTAQAQPEVK